MEETTTTIARYVKIHCAKCGQTANLDIADMKVDDINKEAIEKKLNDERKDGFNCFGKHVEMSPPCPTYWTVDLSEITMEEKKTDETIIKEIKKTSNTVLTKEELRRDWTVLGFMQGYCATRHKETGEEVTFDFTTLPSGNRIYFANSEVNC